MGTSRCALLIFGSLILGLLAGPLTKSAHGEPSWPTYHRDATRSGADPEATNPITPKLSWQSPDLGAPIWSQPLILGSRVYVATVGDEIYALEASTGKIIWEKSAGTPVPSADVLCGDIDPTVGIVGTPVIDTSNNILYAVADVWNATTDEAHHVLQGYNLTTGANVLSTPVDPPGSDPKTLLERPALNIDQGNIIFGFGGNAGDCGEYRGAVASVPESGGPPSFWQYSPAAPGFGGGAVWGPSGPAVDAEGHIYVSTGNPNFPDAQAVETYDDSDSVIELSASMSLIGNFEPESWLSDSNHDRDLGSSGPELLPGGLMFQAGKNEMGYLVDEATMGTGAPAVFGQKVCKGKVEGKGEGSFGGDAYAAGTIYVPCEDGVRALTYNQAARTFTPLWHGPAEATGPPIVSGGLVWVVSGKFLEGKGTKLFGLDPATGAARFTETLPSPVVDHFASPSAAGGRVLVATGASVTAYQISQPATAPAPPTAVGEPASSITQTTATMNGTVNPNNAEVSKCEFEYGTTISYGKTAACAPAPGSGSGQVAVSAAITGLAVSTGYHYRIVAVGPGGTSTGVDETFKTLPAPPTVVSEPASSVTGTSAALNASVNPNGGAMSECRFDYGTTAAYGASVPCSLLPGAGEAAVAVSASLPGLSVNTVYHYRIVAVGPGGTSSGVDETFKTLPAPTVVGELVSSMTGTSLVPATTAVANHGVLSFHVQTPPVQSLKLVGSSLAASGSGAVSVRVSCPAGQGYCRGTMTIRTLNAVTVSRKGKATILTLARGSFDLVGGRKGTLKLRLSARGRTLLAQAHVLQASATIVTQDSTGTTQSQTIVKLR